MKLKIFFHKYFTFETVVKIKSGNKSKISLSRKKGTNKSKEEVKKD